MATSGSLELSPVSFKRFPSSAVLSVISTSELSFISSSQEAKLSLLALACDLEDPLETNWPALVNILPSRETLVLELSKESRP